MIHSSRTGDDVFGLECPMRYSLQRFCIGVGLNAESILLMLALWP